MGLLAVLVVLAFSGCAAVPKQAGEPAPQPRMLALSGTIFYRERIMLPPGSAVVVRLEDVSRMDVASTVVAETRFVPEGGPPYKFVLNYDADLVQPRLRYNLRASIYTGERLRFTSDTSLDPFATEEALAILVKSVASDR